MVTFIGLTVSRKGHPSAIWGYGHIVPYDVPRGSDAVRFLFASKHYPDTPVVVSCKDSGLTVRQNIETLYMPVFLENRMARELFLLHIYGASHDAKPIILFTRHVDPVLFVG